jgi:hypothetical protein
MMSVVKINLEQVTTFSLQLITSVIVVIAIVSVYHINTQPPKIVKADLTLIAKNYINRELTAMRLTEDLSKQQYLTFMQIANKTIEQLAKEQRWIILLQESTLGGVIDVTPIVESAIIKNLPGQ